MPDEQPMTAEAVLRLLVEQAPAEDTPETDAAGLDAPRLDTDVTSAADEKAARFAQLADAKKELPAETVEALKRLFPAGAAPAAQAVPALAPAAVPSALRQDLRRSAAVLSAFEPARLRPLDMEAEAGAALTELAGDLVPATHVKGPHNLWMLRPDLRDEALRGLGRRQLVRALEANPERLDDPLQRTLEAVIRGNAKELGEQTLDELARTLQAVRWLEPARLALPPVRSIHERMEAKRVVAVFEELVENFVGRAAELGRLRDFVGVLEPSGQAEGGPGRARQRFAQVEQPPIAFYAIGGAGKSSLVAKFLLDHAQLPEDRRFPYIYLDFDNPTLVVGEPLTILREAARQLAVQYPSGRPALARFIAGAEAAVRRPAGPDRTLDAGGLEAVRQTARTEQRYARLHERFAGVVRGIVQRRDDEGDYLLPLLVVVDTYEEVQNRGVDHELRLWTLLDSLRADFPSLRVVVFGRGPLERIPTTGQMLKPRPLGPLPKAAAEALLRRCGVTDRSAIQALYREYGGNPLSLKLAAQAYLAEQRSGSGRPGVEQPDTARLPVAAARENLVQGQLYHRVLRHIRSPDVRRLAHPGLVLRRVTPALIKEVLQGPCGVPVPTEQRAAELFEELRREVALVTVEPDGALRHRPDVRRVMLKLIQLDKPEKVAEINRLAVRYYEGHPELSPPAEARGEELYHRLQLEQPPAEIERRWMDEAADHLRGALYGDELPLASQPVLASLLGVELPDKVLKAADQERWERYTASVAAEYIESGHYDAALRALSKRSRRRWSPGSSLHLLEARVYLLLGRFPEAGAALGRAMAAADRSHSRAQLLDTLVLGTQIADEQGDRVTADERLARAQTLAVVLKDPVRQIEVVLRRLRLRQAPGSAVPGDPELHQRLARLLSDLPDQQWVEHQSLVRQGVLGLGFERPELLLRLVRVLGAARPNPAQRARLAELLAEVTRLDAAASDRARVYARTLGLPEPDGSRAAMEALLAGMQEAGRLSEFYEQMTPLIAAHAESRRLGSSILPQLFAVAPEDEEEGA